MDKHLIKTTVDEAEIHISTRGCKEIEHRLGFQIFKTHDGIININTIDNKLTKEEYDYWKNK